MSRVIVLDIDNTLGDYKCAWLDFVRERTGMVAESLDDVRANLPREIYQSIKEEFRASGRKRNMSLISEDIPEVLRRAADAGWKIAIVSSRPAYTNAMVASDTIIWLARHDIASDYMYFTKEKGRLIKDLFSGCLRCVVVEDELEFARDIAERGFEVLLLAETPGQAHPGITYMTSAIQAISYLLGEEPGQGEGPGEKTA